LRRLASPHASLLIPRLTRSARQYVDNGCRPFALESRPVGKQHRDSRSGCPVALAAAACSAAGCHQRHDARADTRRESATASHLTRSVGTMSADNPDITNPTDVARLAFGNEDGVIGDALYREIMGVFKRRIRERYTRMAKPG